MGGGKEGELGSEATIKGIRNSFHIEYFSARNGAAIVRLDRYGY